MPVPYVLLETALGWRVFGSQGTPWLLSWELATAGGSVMADGTMRAGEAHALFDVGSRVVSFGRFERALNPRTDDILTAYTTRSQGWTTVILDNADGYFTRIMAREPVLGKRVRIHVGYSGDRISRHLSLFVGTVAEARPVGTELALDVEESLSGLNETYYLRRANDFPDAGDTGSALPLPYGNLTDAGEKGVWTCPCIDKTRFVYAYAGRPVLSKDNGNPVRVWADGEALYESDFTFKHADPDYGDAATITLDSDPEGKTITASGMGRDNGVGRLMNNLVDVMEDFLGLAGWAGEWDVTARSRTRSVFQKQEYALGGVVTEDTQIFQVLQDMAASFLGSVYLDGPGRLVVRLGSDRYKDPVAALVGRRDTGEVQPRQSLRYLVNQCPANFRYLYADGSWDGFDDGEHTRDPASQRIFGVRQPGEPYPFYWCRDLASVRTMQAFLVERFKNPVWVMDFTEVRGRCINVDVGDILACTFKGLFSDGEEMVNQLVRVLSVRPDLDRMVVEFTAMDTGRFLPIQPFSGGGPYLAGGAYLADGSYQAGGNRDTNDY